MISEINKVHTSCKNCVWAEYQGDTQTDCDLGRITKFKNVLECYDEEKEFFVINNAYCLFYRNKESVEGMNLEELYKNTRKQMEIMYQLIIYFEDSDDVDSVCRSIVSAVNQKIIPQIVTIINRSPKQGVGKDIAEFFKKYDKDINIWRVQNLINKSLTREDCIDIVLDGTMYKNFSFYSVINAGFELPEVFSTELDSAINDDIVTFGMLLPNEDGNGMVVPKYTHKVHNGNSHGIYLESKIREVSCNSQAQILPISQVCQSFPK